MPGIFISIFCGSEEGEATGVDCGIVTPGIFISCEPVVDLFDCCDFGMFIPDILMPDMLCIGRLVARSVDIVCRDIRLRVVGLLALLRFRLILFIALPFLLV